MGLFLSTFVNKIDKKGGVSVPASFRAALSAESFQGFIAFRSYRDAAVECCGYARMQRLSESVDALDAFSPEQDHLASTIFADAQMLVFDVDGRVVLPALLVEHASLTDQVAFVGRGGTFQLWHPQAFEDAQRQARKNVQEGRGVLKLVPSKPGDAS